MVKLDFYNKYRNTNNIMSFINSIIKIFVGDKSQNDVKALQPYLTKIKGFESSLMTLSNDELRARTTYFKEKIKQVKLQYSPPAQPMA